MYSQETVLELVELIYTAAGDPAQWAKLLERLSTIVRGAAGTIHHARSGSQETSFGAIWNLDLNYLQPYAEHFSRLNLWMTTRPEIIVQGRVNTGEMLCPDEVMRRSEFHNDFLLPMGVSRSIAATVLKDGPVSSNLTIFGPHDAEPFSAEDCALLNQLMPHLQRAFQLHNRIQGLERRGAAAGEALDRLDRAVVLLDEKGQVLLVNYAANALLNGGNGLKLTGRGLVAAIASESKRLGHLIHGAVETGQGKGLHAGGAMLISRGGSRGPLQVLVTPLRTKTIQFGKHVPVVAIFISDPDHKPASDAAVLAQLFRLTRAEARLAQILASGESLKDASAKLGVAESTVRSQLKAIFGKTNTNRQGQLVRILNSIQVNGQPGS